MIKNTRIYKGYWWLPSNSEVQVAGTLTIESSGSLCLELYGGFCVKDDTISFEKETENAIYGRCYAPNGHMKDITLFECHPAINLNLSSVFPIIRYSCRYSLIGIHAESMDKTSFFDARVEFAELAYWCPPKNIKTLFDRSSITLTLDISCEKEKMTSIKLENGITLNLNQECSYNPNYPQIHIDQSTTLQIEKEEISGNEVLAATKMFERFLSLCMLTPVEHGKIMLRSKDCYQEMENGKLYYHSIELVQYHYRSISDVEVKTCEILFNHDDIAQDFESMYNRFNSDQSIAQIWSNMIDSLEKKRVYSSNEFLVVMQALDGFAMRFRKEDGIEKELKALRDEFVDIKKVKLTDENITAAAGSRNYYSHILKLEKKEQKHAVDGLELFELTKKLRILLICCVLNFLGMDNGKINELFGKCNHNVLRG